jgi:succinate dehydrogenase/fumarate reductase cytochrome b subunit
MRITRRRVESGERPMKSGSVEVPVATQRLRRLARLSAWLLLASVIILVITGWGITQTGIIFKLSLGLIDRKTADFIHRSTNVPLAIFFLSHVLLNIKLALERRNYPTSGWINNILIIIGAAIMAVVLYMEYWT